MEVRDIVSRVSRHFYDLVDEDANPLVVALALQDNSSVGLQHHAGEFARLHEDLRQALKVRVDANYQGFNTSVGVYHSTVSALKSGHADIHDARQQLADVHNQLTKRKPMLKDLQQKSALFKRKLEILADLEEIQSVPSRYEDRVARKQFRDAQSLLSYALEKINSRDLLRQPTIRPLYQYFTTQQSQLYSRVLDEIRAHIYLSSPYAQRRIASDSDDYVSFIKRLPELPSAQFDSQESPESNSFSYLVMLGETLAALHRLSDGLDELVRRASEDLHQLAQRITANVVVELKLSPESLKNAALSGGTLIDQFKAVDQTALSTLAASLYSHLAAVLEGYRAIVEISAQLGVRRNASDVYLAVISEARALLLRYIGGTNPPTMPMRRRTTSDTNSISHVSRSRLDGTVFEFGDGDEDSRGLRDFDALREALKKSVPGLLTDDPHHLFADTHQQQRMEVVSPAHILNIRPLLEPSVTFFARAGAIVKGDAAEKQFNTFLDDFLQQSFVPRLQQAFDNAVEAISTEEDAASESSTWSTRSQLPLAKCVEQFADTIGLLCQLLDMGSSFREDYAAILVGLLSKISLFLETRMRVLLAGDRRVGKMWSLASAPQLSGLLSRRYSGKAEQGAEFTEFFAQRSPPGSTKPPIVLGDLLDIGTYTQASLLITSIRWLALVLRKMRRVAPSASVAPDTSRRENSSTAVRRRWMLLDAPAIKEGAVTLQRTYAVLAGKPLENYDQNVASLDSIVQRALATLRTDVYCRIVYYFDQMVIGRDFQSSRRREERDPVVDRLQREISLIAQVTESGLINTDRDFLLDGVAQFMNEMFILEAENVREMSESGQSQMLTNIFALQQMLTSIVSDPRDVDFSRATSFYELFRLGPTIILERVRIGESDMSIDDLKLLLAIRHRKSNSAAAGSLSEHYAAVDEIFNADAPSQGKQAKPAVMPLRTKRTVEPSSKSDNAAGSENKNRQPSTQSNESAAQQKVKQEQSAAETRRAEMQKQEAARREAEAKLLQKQRRERKAQMEAEIKRRDEDRLQRAHEDAKQREAERLEAERRNAERRLKEERDAKVREESLQRERAAAEAQRKQQREAEQLRAAAEAREQQELAAIEARRNQALHEQRAREQEHAKMAAEAQRRSEEAKQVQARAQTQNHTQAQAQAQAKAQVQAQATANPHNPTVAAPAPEAARSPLLNHRIHSEQQQQPQQPKQPQSQQRPERLQQHREDVLPQPPLPPQHRQQSRSRSPSNRSRESHSSRPSSPPQPPPHSTQNLPPLPRIRTRASGSSLRSQNMSPTSPVHSPVTPTSPGEETRQRTASERALEAAQRVRQRSLPQPTIRRTK